MRKSRFVGREKLDFQFVLTMAAYNLVRMRNLGGGHRVRKQVLWGWSDRRSGKPTGWRYE